MLIVNTSGQVTGLANTGSELYVSDSAANRIRVYHSETLAELRSWSSDRPKQIAVDNQRNLGTKLNGLIGVGTDKAVNIYVSNDGFASSGTDLRNFSHLGKMQWQVFGLQFVDNADAYPGTDGLQMFMFREHFRMDYSKSNGQE